MICTVKAYAHYIDEHHEVVETRVINHSQSFLVHYMIYKDADRIEYEYPDTTNVYENMFTEYEYMSN